MNRLKRKSGTGSYMSKRVSIFSACILVCSLQSCKLLTRLPRIEIVTDEQANKSDTSLFVISQPSVDTSDAKKELIKNINPVWRRRISFNTFSGKAKMQYEGGGKNYDFVANIRIKKDSVIWISVSALGGIVQVARALITPDSMKAIIYLEKIAYNIPLNKANDFLPAGINFYSLQNLLIGNPVIDEGTPTDATHFGGTWSIQLDNKNYTQQLNYNVADSSLRSCQVLSKDKNNMAMTIQYGNYELLSLQKFSDTRKVNILNADKQYTLDMNFVNSSIDIPIEFSFSIPKNYEVKH